MYRSSKLPWLLLLLGLLAALTLVGDNRASVPTTRGKDTVKKEMRWARDLSGTTDNLFTVPEDRKFIVTDFTVTNSGSGFAHVVLTRGSPQQEISASLLVGSNKTFHQSCLVGPVVPAGKTLQVHNKGTGLVGYYVSGYLTR